MGFCFLQNWNQIIKRRKEIRNLFFLDAGGRRRVGGCGYEVFKFSLVSESNNTRSKLCNHVKVKFLHIIFLSRFEYVGSVMKNLFLFFITNLTIFIIFHENMNFSFCFIQIIYCKMCFFHSGWEATTYLNFHPPHRHRKACHTFQSWKKAFNLLYEDQICL